MKNCPQCKIELVDHIRFCGCGYDFNSEKTKGSQTEELNRYNETPLFSTLLKSFGLIALFGGLYFSIVLWPRKYFTICLLSKCNSINFKWYICCNLFWCSGFG